MNKTFEIKSHDGPGRVGKLGEDKTPILIDEKYKIIESEESAYDIQREISEWSVKQTLEKGKMDKNNECDIAVIQGSKYVDLRVQCAKELEKIGYNGFLIANGDDLILHPRDLVDLTIALRENLSPNSYLIFSFAESSFIPLLSYMGIDGFLKGSGEYYSYLNVLISPTKNYDLKKYDIYKMTQEELLKYNNNTIDFVLKEVQEHMKNGTLRNLVEERSSTSPQNTSALRILDKNYQEYLQKYTPLY
jgi:predicted RNA-binding protein